MDGYLKHSTKLYLQLKFCLNIYVAYIHTYTEMEENIFGVLGETLNPQDLTHVSMKLRGTRSSGQLFLPIQSNKMWSKKTAFFLSQTEKKAFNVKLQLQSEIDSR